MGSVWAPVEDRRAFGVAKNFLSEKDLSHVNFGLKINLGESFIIKEECREWYYVKKIGTEEEGIVPKSFIHISECNVIRQSKEVERVIPKLAPLVQELDPVLSAWHMEATKLFVEMKEDAFENIRKKILELHDCRKNILSPNLPAEDLRDLKKQVAYIIDTGNHILGFDMCVRDDRGNLLNPSVTSTIEFYRKHKEAAKKLKGQVRSLERIMKPTHHNCHSFLVEVESIKWRIVDRCELRFFLYDGGEEKAFSECGVVVLEGPPSHNLKFLFTDLGKFDRERKRIFLVVYVIRIGAMEYKEIESKKEIPFAQRFHSQQVRRPWGVATKEVTGFFKDKGYSNLHSKREQVILIPYMPYGDQESIEAVLNKMTKEIKDNKIGLGFTCSVSMISGNYSQIQEEQPLVLIRNPIIVRKMGFPEVILPKDVRNDLYIKLIRGEFHRGDRNIEVTVSVHNELGSKLHGIICSGSGEPPGETYQSVVYYHGDKPKWNEIIKIKLPTTIEDFSVIHIRFTFKHRSSSESKDKVEKPFAMAFLSLRERNGTAIDDGVHDLAVYKIDPKLYKESDVRYLLNLTSMRSQLEGSSKQQWPGFTYSPKDAFFVGTTLCSTKFTQNDKLQQLLQWSTKIKDIAETYPLKKDKNIGEMLLENLKSVLNNVNARNVNGEEIVKFLPDIFDALFAILVNPFESIRTDLIRGNGLDLLSDESRLTEACHRPVFDCLIYIFDLILNKKYMNFQSVLTLYIENGYSGALAHLKLLKELQHVIENPNPPDKILQIMKTIDYFFKFIIQSFNNCITLRKLEGSSDVGELYDEFNKAIQRLFDAMCALVSKREEKYLKAQGGILKHIPEVINSLCTVFPPGKLSELLSQLIRHVPAGKLTLQKLGTIKSIVRSSLFLEPVCRNYLVPIVIQNISNHLPGNEEGFRGTRISVESNIKSKGKILKLLGPEADGFSYYKTLKEEDLDHSKETVKCVKLLSKVMDILYRKDIGSTGGNIYYIMQILMIPLIMSIGTIGEKDRLAAHMVAILLSIFRQMTSRDYTSLVNELKQKDGDRIELQKFLSNILVVMKNFFSKPYFPSDWTEMILLQNSILMTGMEHFAQTLKAEFVTPFNEQPWTNFFICSVSFLTQESLQIEEFSPYKRFTIISRYDDMRKRAAELIRQMWFSLGEAKRMTFVPTMVGTFLDMALVPEPEIRRSSISIFFDMMRCEFDSGQPPRKSFKEVEDELIKRLVELVEGGKGDRGFRAIFDERMSEMCEHDNSGIRIPGLRMVDTISRLLELLLEYREVAFEEDKSNQMSCIVNLLEFSKEINKKDLYLRYLYKLHDSHMEKNNFTEAAFTLKLHSRQLDWSQDEIPSHLKSPRHPHVDTQIELKELLYEDIIDYFVKSKMWECGLEVCEELRFLFSEETFNYNQLPYLHRRMADFYQEIVKPKDMRWEPEYFRVGFYGRGFPSFLQNKVFIYRGKPLEKLADFSERMLERFPNAIRLKKLNPPSDKKKFSNYQYLQMNAVVPVMNTSEKISRINMSEDCIKKYYKVNEIDKFTYSRPHFREPKDPNNECASLWLERYHLWTSHMFPGILSWFKVVKETVDEIRPIQNAIEEMIKSNNSFRELVILHDINPGEPLGNLSLKLDGTLDASVNGGVKNYENAFLTDEYLEQNALDYELVEMLKRLIIEQSPLLKYVLHIHKRKCGEVLAGMQKKLEDSYASLNEHLKEAYGVDPESLTDQVLIRDLKNARKRTQANARKRSVQIGASSPPTKVSVNGRNSDSNSLANVSAKLGSSMARSIGSFSSTINIPQSKGSIGKSASKSNQGLFRRSTNLTGSIENDHNSSIGVTSFLNNSATLPRNGSSGNSTFHLMFQNNKKLSTFEMPPPPLPPLLIDDLGSRSSNAPSPADNQVNLIPLYQTLTPHRPLRPTQMDGMRSQSQNWSHEIPTMLQTFGDNVSDRGSGSSNIGRSSPASDLGFEDDATPPKLPPKNMKKRDKGRDEQVPQIPPKPPLRKS